MCSSDLIQQQTGFGFIDPSKEHESKYEAIKVKMNEEIKKEFKPEFLNRIDDIIIFKSLIKEDIESIVDIMLDELKNRLKEKNISIKYDKKVKDLLVENGFDQLMGARPLRRAIQEHFEDRLADEILQKGLSGSLNVSATVKDKVIHFTVSKKRKTLAKQLKKRIETLEAVV